jgi:hypothetical protein
MSHFPVMVGFLADVVTKTHSYYKHTKIETLYFNVRD